MPAGGLVVAGVIGLGTAVYGAIQKDKAAKAARNNVMPEYQIPQSEYQNLSLAESRAGQGMSDAARQSYLNDSNAGLTASTNAILRGGGNANAIASAENGYQQGINRLAIYDDTARMENLSRLSAAYSRMSANVDKTYQVNQYGPWANRAQALAQQEAAGQSTMMQGIGTLGSAASGLAGGAGTPSAGRIAGVRDTSGDIHPSRLATAADSGNDYGSYSSPPPASDIGIYQRQVPGTYGATDQVNASNNFTTWGNGQDSASKEWSWNGYYPVAPPQ